MRAFAGVLLLGAVVALPVTAADMIVLSVRAEALPIESSTPTYVFGTATDSNGQARGGARVVLSPGSCESFEGLAPGEAVTLVTDTTFGSFTSPPLKRMTTPGSCKATAMIAGDASSIVEYTNTRYERGSVQIALVEGSESFDGEKARIGARFTWHGQPLPGMVLSCQEGPGSFAYPSSSMGCSAATYEDGLVGITSNYVKVFPGAFDLQFNFPFETRVIRVEGTRRPDPPPVPATALKATVDKAYGPVTISLENAGPSPCSMGLVRAFEPAASGIPGLTTPNHAYLYDGAFSFQVSKCAFQGPAGAAKALDIRLDAPQVAQGTALFAWGLRGDGAGGWQRVPAAFTGSTVRFTVSDNGLFDSDPARDEVRLVVALGTNPTYGDLWWGGAAENGWGLSITQHRDARFGVLFAYDAAGKPTWHVMSEAPWNPDRTTWGGPFYEPHGSPFYDYRPDRFVVGPSPGTMTLRPNDDGSMAFDFRLGGSAPVTKRLVLQRGDVTHFENGLEDIWYGGSADAGYGIAIHPIGSTYFLAWFTYDANGERTWYVMSDAHSSYSDEIRGTVYKTTGAPFAQAYDPSRFKVTPVGSFVMKFVANKAYFDYIVEGKRGRHVMERQAF